MSGAPALRLAVEADGQWRELTAAGPGRVERFRAPALRDAADKTARCAAAAFVDLDVYLADSVPAAFAGLARQRPGWVPGRREGTLVHAGTPATLAGLLADIWSVKVAHGVTLRPIEPAALEPRLAEQIISSTSSATVTAREAMSPGSIRRMRFRR